MAKEFLSRNHIHFIEKDINVDAEAREELIRRSVRGVPAFLIGDDLVVGFDKSRILELVDHRLTECENCGVKMRVPNNRGSIKVTCPRCRHAFDLRP